jgi:nitric oxide reductase NorD protein
MAEPEDLLLEFAHRGVVAAQRLWLRYHPDADAAARSLAGLRAHLELVLAGLADRPLVLVPAEPAAPASWVARLARPTPRHLRDSPPAATDGARIYLPRTLPAALARADLSPPCAYRLLLAGQVARLRREAPALAPGDPSTPLHLLYELAESVAAERWLALSLPGLLPDLLTGRRASLACRPAPALLRPAEREIEELLRRALAAPPGEPAPGVPCPDSPAESRRWAADAAAALPTHGGRCRGLPAVAAWGRLLAPAPADPVPAARADDSPTGRTRPGRTQTLRRTPEAREPEPDEDSARMGTWIIRPDEPQESVEDPFGLQRPADLDDDAAPEELADALADLPRTRVVSTPTPPEEVLTSESPVPRGVRPQASTAGSGLVYPEWDCRVRAYRLRGTVVREYPLEPGDGTWSEEALERHAALVRQVRRQFAALRPQRSRLRRQRDGTDLDMESWVETWADRRAGVAGAAGEDRFYVAERAARRSLAIALLIDVSASTDSWVADTRRVIDIEKEALLVVGQALGSLGDRWAVYAFSGEGPGGVRMYVARAFGDGGGAQAARRIERLEPDGYTRVGAAVRHATARLAAEPAHRRLLLILTDGRPNDVDQYEGRYGIEDTRQAVREAVCEGVLVFGLTVDRTAPAYLSAMFGPGRAALLRRPEHLPATLVEVLRRLLGGG